MRHSEFRHLPARLACMTTLSLMLSLGAQAQGEELEGDLVYMFRLFGISGPEAAKDVQYALLDNPDVHMCTFIQEETCFKLASPTEMDLAAFQTLVGITGFELNGPVLVSSGVTLGMNGPAGSE
jgi:hypothetical protein